MRYSDGMEEVMRWPYIASELCGIENMTGNKNLGEWYKLDTNLINTPNLFSKKYLIIAAY